MLAQLLEPLEQTRLDRRFRNVQHVGDFRPGQVLTVTQQDDLTLGMGQGPDQVPETGLEFLIGHPGQIPRGLGRYVRSDRHIVSV